ncbi:MFS transporter [Desulfatiglans anilini]|uniref:MFS transporter n=1 Tax=Desulfatiglans anilini TaxID=90728 RepID=UPI00042873F2|nr:MFS transporter [Desulfatiglans anilini]
MVSDALGRALRYRWLIFWILAFGYVLVYFHRLCPAVVAVDMMRDLNAGGALTGLLGAAYFYPYALMQLPAGLLSDSWGPRNTITLFFLVAIAGSFILGFAPSVFLAIIGRTLVGLGIAMLFVPTMKVLAEWFETKEFATMTGILMAMGGLGSLIAAAPLAWVSNLIGWRMSFVAVGVLTLILAVLVWFFVRDKPQDMGFEPPMGAPKVKPEAIGLMQGVAKVVKEPFFWPVAVWFFFDCAVFFSFGGLWGGPYLIQVYGMSKGEAGRILSMLAIGMILGSPLLSYASNRVFKGRKPVLILSSTILVALTAVLAFATASIPTVGLYAVCLGLGVFSSAVVVIGFITTKELFPVQMAGTATGLVNLFPFAGGAVFQPLLGYVLEKGGQGVGGAFTLAAYRQAFLVLFVCGVIAFLASLFTRETLARQ